MSLNPSEIIAQEKMGRFQILAVVICVLLNAVDGFDVLAISFAAPGISADWGIDRAGLGVVLSMELIGMAIGSVIIGRIADIWGRRPIILSCILIMAGGMLLTAFSKNVFELSTYRFLTGIGIGGMLASTNAMVAEYANRKHRNLCVTIMAAGFPIGAIVGGSIASLLLAKYSWNSVFLLGAGMTIFLLPFVFLLLPESISFLMKARPKDALGRINTTLKRMGHSLVEALPDVKPSSDGSEKISLLSKGWRRILLLMIIAYFAHIMTFYYILKWIPKIVVDMGQSPALAGSVLVWANVGGACGSILLGLFSQKFPLRNLVIGALLLSAILIGVFGLGYDTLRDLSIIAAIAGFFTNAGVVGLYALMASTLPTEIRAGGTGLVIGLGRGGAALGPILAGLLFASGASLLTVSCVMACGSIIGAIALFGLPRKSAGHAQ